METDPEIKEGRDQHYTTFFRQYDPRLGRWWSHDPVKQMGESPYAAMFNNPVLFGDALGSDPESSPLEPGGGGGGGGGRNAHRGWWKAWSASELGPEKMLALPGQIKIGQKMPAIYVP